jgi:nucleoside-diphosphate kinase
MAIERTFTIIKPDSTAAGHIGEIITEIERAGFQILAMRKTRLTRPQAEAFYQVHRERPFFDSLVAFMTEGEIVAMALERENAVTALRDLMGATDSTKAAEGTIRNKFGTNIERNAIHGSDAPETAAAELAFFFSSLELSR